jgi:hypothetical protein
VVSPAEQLQNETQRMVKCVNGFAPRVRPIPRE